MNYKVPLQEDPDWEALPKSRASRHAMSAALCRCICGHEERFAQNERAAAPTMPPLEEVEARGVDDAL